MVTVLLSRPMPGAVNSGIRVVVASNCQLVYGVLIRSSGCRRSQMPAPRGSDLVRHRLLVEGLLELRETRRFARGQVDGLRESLPML